MPISDKEKWQVLCDLARREQDPKRLAELVDELERMLDQQERSPDADQGVAA